MSDENVKKKRLNLKGWWWKFPIAGIGLLVLLSSLGILGTGGLPECSSSNAKGTLTDAFNQSQFARSLNLSAIQISNPHEATGSSAQRRNCTAELKLNNGESAMTDFVMTLQENGQYMLEFEVRN